MGLGCALQVWAHSWMDLLEHGFGLAYLMTANTEHQFGAASLASRCEWCAHQALSWHGGMGLPLARAPAWPITSFPEACGHLRPLMPLLTWGAMSSHMR